MEYLIRPPLRSFIDKLLFSISVISLISPFFIGANTAYASGAVILVYPVYHNDTDRIIFEIRDGIKTSHDNNITEIPFDTLDKSDATQKRIHSLSDDDIVITLTNELENIIRRSGFKGQLIDGVSVNQVKRKSTISVGIQSSPLAYIETLIKLSPETKNILYFTLGNENQGKHETDSIHYAVGSNDVEVELIHVVNINDAMHEINDVISHYDPSETAIWMPNKLLSLSNNTVLKYVLREAWRKSFIVFTDSLEAVDRGLLFSLIPDYRSYGIYLGQLAHNIAEGNESPLTDIIRYFDDVYLMINQRFSVHLGLNINRSLFKKYKIVVPAK